MRVLLKSALAVAALAATTTLVPAVATAGVSIGIGIPAVIAPYGPGYATYDDQYYYEPVFISGSWYHGPYRWRMWQGERVFFVDGRWHRNEWRGRRVPTSIMFRNGGAFRDGRYEGFDGAERINARFRPGNSNMREDRRDLGDERSDMRQDRGDMRQDRPDSRDGRDVGHDRDSSGHNDRDNDNHN